MKEVRERFHEIFRNPNNDMEMREQAKYALVIFDRHVAEKKWSGQKPGYLVHREHGWGLYKTD